MKKMEETREENITQTLGEAAFTPAQRPVPQEESLPPAQLATIDEKILQQLLDGSQSNTREQVRELLATGKITSPTFLTMEEKRVWVKNTLPFLKTVPGVYAAFPEGFGGTGDRLQAGIAFATLAHGDLSLLIKTGVQWGLFGGAIQNLGTEKHLKYLPSVADLSLMGCFAMTEINHGSDVQNVQTTATYNKNRRTFNINTPSATATKTYIGNAGVDGVLAVVFAQLYVDNTCHGVHAFIVPIRENGEPCPGVTITDMGPKMGLNGVDNGCLSFDNVQVPYNSLLDRYGQVNETGEYFSPITNPSKRFFTMLGTLVQGRVSVAGAAISATQNALNISVNYANTRTQFTDEKGREVTLMQYRSHQRRLLPLLAENYALHFAQQNVLQQLASDKNLNETQRKKLEGRIAGHKAMSTWHASKIIQETREACGGAGYISENRLGLLKNDTEIFTTFEGDNTVLTQLVAKNLLQEYKKVFDSKNFFGTAKYVASQTAENFLERNIARSSVEKLRRANPEDGSSVQDVTWQLKMLDFKEMQLTQTVVKRLRHYQKTLTPWEAFNECQDHPLSMAKAHTERLTFEAFLDVIQSCEDQGTQKVLKALCSLYALTLIEKDRGYFLENGRLSPERSKTITVEVNKLCSLLAPHSQSSVNAYQIPQVALRAPIAVLKTL